MAKRTIWKAAMLSAAIALPGVAISAASAGTGPVSPSPHKASADRPDPASNATAKNLLPIKPGSAFTAAAQDFNFYNRPLKAEGMCLTRVGTGYDGAVVLRNCSNDANQLWSGRAVARDANYNYYFQISNNGYCLQNYNNMTNSGAAIDTSPCSSYPLYQKQLWDESGTTGSVTFKTYATAISATSDDECLAPSSTTPSDGEPLAQRSCLTAATGWSII